MSLAHHPIFETYVPWSGHVEPEWEINFLGVRTRRTFVTHEPTGHLGTAIAGYPIVNEEYFEWIDLLESVEAATRSFTMIELGAGYGRWLVNGGVAARARGLKLQLVGVEAEPTHFRWLQEHCKTNGLSGSDLRLIEAAVAPTAGWVRFHIGDPVDWYGQAIDPGRPDFSRSRRLRDAFTTSRRKPSTHSRSIERVRAVTLPMLLRELPAIDLIDADIQGSEADVFETARDLLEAKVARVHIGTHSPDNEDRLRTLFTGLGWICKADFGSSTVRETEWGRVDFQDGVQSWLNPITMQPPEQAEAQS